MFKGPASLTSGSVVNDASNISATNLTINNTSDNTVEIADDVIIGGDLNTTTGYITATTITAKIQEKVTKLTSTITGSSSFGTINVDNINVLYFADITRTSAAALAATISWSTIQDGHRLFIAWTKKAVNSNTPSVKLDFGANKIYTTSTNGPDARYITFNGLGQNCILYYNSNINAWMKNANNGVTITTS